MQSYIGKISLFILYHMLYITGNSMQTCHQFDVEGHWLVYVNLLGSSLLHLPPPPPLPSVPSLPASLPASLPCLPPFPPSVIRFLPSPSIPSLPFLPPPSIPSLPFLPSLLSSWLHFWFIIIAGLWLSIRSCTPIPLEFLRETQYIY